MLRLYVHVRVYMCSPFVCTCILMPLPSFTLFAAYVCVRGAARFGGECEAKSEGGVMATPWRAVAQGAKC